MDEMNGLLSRRSGLQILVDILEGCFNQVSKTHVVYSSNLNFKIVQRHLKFLIDKGLLETVNSERSRRTYYRTTDKGREFLENYKKLTALFQSKS